MKNLKKKKKVDEIKEILSKEINFGKKRVKQ
jgi:hypothetical protein